MAGSYRGDAIPVQQRAEAQISWVWRQVGRYWPMSNLRLRHAVVSLEGPIQHIFSK